MYSPHRVHENTASRFREGKVGRDGEKLSEVQYITNTDKELLKDLEGKSETLATLGREFPILLRRRAEK
jgi:hypothetical protein